MERATLSVIQGGFPPELRVPKPLPGESLAQLVIRNHPQEWRNCVERLGNDFGVSEAVCARLLRGEVSAVSDEAAQDQIEGFMNFRLPSHGRTLQGLAELREALRAPRLGKFVQIELTEIIWPWQGPPRDPRAESLAESLGVIVVDFDTAEAGPIDLESLLDHVHGDFLWVLPGGTRVWGAMAVMALTRVLRTFQERPKMALYSDQHYSQIYRTEALRALLKAGKALSADARENGRLLQEADFGIAADDERMHALAELEPLYGGPPDDFPQSLAGGKTSRHTARGSWWRRLLGLG